MVCHRDQFWALCYFLLYVNDIVNVSRVLLLLLYADDTNTFLSGKNLDQMIETMNEELAKLVVWLNVNKLKLNVKKTHFMIFSSGRKEISYSNKLFICNDEIKAVKHTKFLGAIIDQRLSWENHITHIKKKVARGLAIISKAKKFLNSTALKTLYYSFIYPYFDYCIEVWGSACKTRIDTLFRMQKKAIRIITMSHYRDDTIPLFDKCKILTLQEIHVYKAAIFMFKVYHKMAPMVFQEYFLRNHEIHDYSTRIQSKLRVPHYKLEIMKFSIRVKGVYIWNFVCDHISPDCSLNSIKISLRKLISGNKQIESIIPKKSRV